MSGLVVFRRCISTKIVAYLCICFRLMDSCEPWSKEFHGPGMKRKPNLFYGCFLFLIPQGPPVAEFCYEEWRRQAVNSKIQWKVQFTRPPGYSESYSHAKLSFDAWWPYNWQARAHGLAVFPPSLSSLLVHGRGRQRIRYMILIYH